MLIGENCYCWPLKMVWKKVASQGKVSEKSGNLDMDIEWQPWDGHRGNYILHNLVIIHNCVHYVNVFESLSSKNLFVASAITEMHCWPSKRSW